MPRLFPCGRWLFKTIHSFFSLGHPRPLLNASMAIVIKCINDTIAIHQCPPINQGYRACGKVTLAWHFRVASV